MLSFFIRLLLLSFTWSTVSARVGNATWTERRHLQEGQSDLGGIGNGPGNRGDDDGRYIVMCAPKASLRGCNGLAIAWAAEADNEGRVRHMYDSVFFGFAIENVRNKNAIERLKNNGLIESVEVDEVVEVTGVQELDTVEDQWGLDRIDQVRPIPEENPPNTYRFPNEGDGIDIYIVDNGVWPGHSQFGGRVVEGYNAVADFEGFEFHGFHGTHVAGIAAGTLTGVAKQANIYDVKVLLQSGSGYSSDIVAGLNWVANNAVPGRSVVNMSVRTSANNGVNNAIAAIYDKGIPVIASSGNDSNDACNYSPASAGRCYVVGNSDKTDTRFRTSNYGDCVDLFAPGQRIWSAWFQKKNPNPLSFTYSTGTSMAAPHVTGAAALILRENPGYSAQQIYNKLTADAAIAGTVVGDSRGGGENLLYTGLIGPLPPTNAPSTSSPTTASPTTASPTTSSPTIEGPVIHVEVQYDSLPEETSLSLYHMAPEGTETLLHVGFGDAEGPKFDEEFLAEPGDYRFTIRDKNRNGICCESGEGYYRVYVNGVVQAEGGKFNRRNMIDFVVPRSSSATSNPTTSSPTTSAPTTVSPTSSPTTSSPTTGSPTTSSPTTDSPTTSNPTTSPTTSSPTTSAPSTGSPTTDSPTTSSPTTGDSGLGVIRVEVQYDDSPEETSVRLLNVETGKKIFFMDFGDFMEFTESDPPTFDQEFPVEPGTYEVMIRDSARNGICRESGVGAYRIYVNGEMQVEGCNFNRRIRKQLVVS